MTAQTGGETEFGGSMLTGVTNFRDFGGYPTGDGRSVRTGVLFRCGHLAGATQADIEELTALGLSVIVDLRREPERERQPTGGWADRCRTIRSDLLGGDDPWWTFLRVSDLSVGSIRRHLLDFYRGLPFDPSYIDLFSRFFQALATTTGPLLVHCTGGKDRTGVVVALTHRLLGVHPDDTLADYLLTNRVWQFDHHGAAVASGIAAVIGRTPGEAAVRAVMEVEAGYLAAGFDAIEAQCGSLDAYFEDTLSVTRAAREAIALRLIGHP
jgi:protein-tyrosine phosphatase